jgi:hypothetical protein
LLEVASTGAYRPLWSAEILAELDRTLRRMLRRRCSAIPTPLDQTFPLHRYGDE